MKFLKYLINAIFAYRLYLYLFLHKNPSLAEFRVPPKRDLDNGSEGGESEDDKDVEEEIKKMKDRKINFDFKMIPGV